MRRPVPASGPPRAARVLLPLALAGLLLPLAARADDATPAGGNDLEAAVRWLDGRGFVDPASRPFVKVFTGATDTTPDGRKVPHVEHGLLVVDEGERFEVLTTTLESLELEPSAPDAPPERRVGYQEASLPDVVASVIDRWKADRARSRSERFLAGGFGPHLDPRGEALVLAWMCWKRGLQDDARRVWEAGGPADEAKPRLPEAQREIETTLYWRIVEAFGAPGAPVPPNQLIADITTYLRRFPGVAWADDARRLRANLVQSATTPERPEPGPEAPIEDRVAWLVDRLTTQNGQQPGQPGRCDVFLDPRGDESPAQRLVRLGYDAVPRLLEALDDLRTTRSIGFVRDFYFSHHVLRVCDVALDVLESIAGQSFWDPPYFSEHVSEADAETREGVRERVRAWWEGAREKGEEAMLQEAVSRGEPSSAYLARRLLEKYPDGALPSIRRALRAAPAGGDRASLVRVLGEVRNDEATALLEEVLRGDASLLARTTAAIALLDRKPEEAIGVMLGAFDAEAMAKATWRLDDAASCHLGFLAGCGDPRGVEAIAARMETSSVWWRVGAITTLANGSWYASMPYVLRPPTARSTARRAPAKVLEAARRLLLGRLGDRAEVDVPYGLSSSLYDPFVLPRVCDFAAWALCEVFPDRYEGFDRAATPLLRDHWIATVLAEERGDAPPPRPEIAPASPEHANTVTAVHWTPPEGADVADLSAALKALEGKPLAPRAFVGVLTRGVLAAAKGPHRFTLRLRRETATGGIRIDASLEEPPKPKAPSGLWPREDEGGAGYVWRLRIGAKGVSGGGGSSGPEYLSKPEAWKDEVETPLGELLDAPPDAVLTGGVEVTVR